MLEPLINKAAGLHVCNFVNKKLQRRCALVNDVKFLKTAFYGTPLLATRRQLIKKILTGKKHPRIKLQRLQNIRISTFGSLVHQVNSF